MLMTVCKLIQTCKRYQERQHCIDDDGSTYVCRIGNSPHSHVRSQSDNDDSGGVIGTPATSHSTTEWLVGKGNIGRHGLLPSIHKEDKAEVAMDSLKFV